MMDVYPDNFLHERMVERELFIQLEAVVHGVALPVTNIWIINIFHCY